ncbi:MAG: serine/threonine-protein kinase [Thermoanaerobaculia bacterium]
MLQSGRLLQGRYRITSLLGEGGMGTVYEVVDERLHSTVALKQTTLASEHLRAQFEREARLLARLRHPALTKVIDHFSEEDGQFLVMEYIEGPDLHQRMKQRGAPFAVQEVVAWSDQLLDALDYLHTQATPIVHRDIKPQNLKLTIRTQIILLDFGLA